ncbi:MAG: dUTP diphosphatase [Rhizobiales bacterium]|nr:dUTP diphosphatase [Hyphomicrobiales bacterium]
MEVLVSRLAHGDGLALPAYQTAGAAGMDLVAAIGDEEIMMLEPGARETVPTGIAIALPKGHEAQIRPRSGLAQRNGVTVLNAPGTVDCDYRGELKVLLINLGDVVFEIRRGERIAQLVIQPVARGLLVEVDSLEQTRRGAGGFGSTGG